jgi:hypothetical protein
MNLFIEILKIVSTGLLGLFVGALLAEGALFVPYWKTLKAEAFFSLHKEYGPRLYRFFCAFDYFRHLFGGRDGSCLCRNSTKRTLGNGSCGYSWPDDDWHLFSLLSNH